MRWPPRNVPPLWIFALPAALGLGVHLGASAANQKPVLTTPPRVLLHEEVRLRPGSPPAAVRADTVHSDPEVVVEPVVRFAGTLDGGAYVSLGGAGVGADTLPAAPDVTDGHAVSAGVPAAVRTAVDQVREPGGPVVSATTGGAGAAGVEEPAVPPAEERDGPAQGLGRQRAAGQPLIGFVRASRSVAFYSAWEAPERRVDLVGEWVAPGRCGSAARLRYEQVAGGLGAVRGVGEARGGVPWDVALVVPRQHCRAGSNWVRSPRGPRGNDASRLAPLLGGEQPIAVITDGLRTWAASASHAVLAREVDDGRLVALWSERVPAGAVLRLLGTWMGDGVWVSVAGGRLTEVWRVSPSGEL